MAQKFPDDKTINLVKFTLPQEWQKQLLDQRFNSSTKILKNIVELCKKLETAKEIFHDKGDDKHPNKKDNKVQIKPPIILIG